MYRDFGSCRSPGEEETVDVKIEIELADVEVADQVLSPKGDPSAVWDTKIVTINPAATICSWPLVGCRNAIPTLYCNGLLFAVQ